MKISELKEKIINEIPIYDVIAMRLTPISHEFKCPFHNETTIGSFKIDKRANRYKCFTCNKYGDAINFIMDYDHVTFNQAVVIIASSFGLISKDEADKMARYFDVKNTYDKTKSYTRINISNQEQSCASLHVMDAVYDVIIKNSPLTSEHRNYLHQRGLSDEMISLYRFFSMNGEDLSEIVQREALIWNVDHEELSRVPGFYVEDDRLKMLSLIGIGIPLLDTKGMINGIQVRKDEADASRGRYVLFSARKKGGTSCGTVFDTIYPKSFLDFKNRNIWLSMNARSTVEKYRNAINNPNALKTLFITEGHFKAITLSNQGGDNIIALSVQGVNNTKGIEAVVKNIVETFDITKIVIAFDADFVINSNVAKAIYKLDLQLKTVFDKTITCLIWNIKDGKGIDDYMINPNKQTGLIYCEPISFINFLIQYHKKYPIKDKKDEAVVKEWCDRFFSTVLKLGRV